MGNDLLLAIVAMIVVSIAAGLFSSMVAYSTSGQWTMLGLALSVFGMVMFLIYLSGQLFWARIVPASAAIIYTNLASVLAALAAGWAWRLPETPLWRRLAMLIMLGLSSLVAILWPLLSMAVRPPPAGGDNWKNGVAMQTSWATCSPAAAATLLQSEGIRVSEAEMIPLCLTDSSGTPTLGLYRGVKLAAERAARRVELLNGSLAELLEDDDWPALLAVRLPYGVDDPRYQAEWGWIPGMGHSVVALGRTDDGSRIIVGDPSVGLETWTKADLEILWHGDGMRIKESTE